MPWPARSKRWQARQPPRSTAAGANHGHAQPRHKVIRMSLTLNPGTLVVESAYPDPPFELMENGTATGFDIELMRAVCTQLGLALRPLAYSGDDFNGIFEGLAKRACDAVISGTTITPERSATVLFSQPYLEFNQAIAVNRRRTPDIVSTADLRGLTAGIQSGNTSDLVARRLAGPRPHSSHPLLSLSRDHGGARRSRGRTHRARHQAVPGNLLAGQGPSAA